MSSRSVALVAVPSLAAVALLLAPAVTPTLADSPEPEWAANVTVIEACSCPMFCQCYFNTHPAGHHDHATGEMKHFCKGNLAQRINHGHYGKLALDGAKYWLVGDLGPDFSQGKLDWGVLIFDKAMSKNQRDAVLAIVKHAYPGQFGSFETSEGSIDTWQANNDAAVATLDGGRTAEVRLKRVQGNTSAPAVISNLRYVGTPRNDGFVLMPNEVEAYRVGQKAFEFKGTNGFVITWDMSSQDVTPQRASN